MYLCIYMEFLFFGSRHMDHGANGLADDRFDRFQLSMGQLCTPPRNVCVIWINMSIDKCMFMNIYIYIYIYI
jgi:hypothetical protein